MTFTEVRPSELQLEFSKNKGGRYQSVFLAPFDNHKPE